MTILVTGAMGGVGRWVLEGLLALGLPVRALCRDPARARAPQTVQVVAGDLREPTTLRGALTGVNGVFLYAQPEGALELAQEMRKAGVERVVVLSTIDVSNLHSYAQHNRRRHVAVEEAVVSAGLRHTFLRPGAFASNARRFWGRGIATEGVVRLPYPNAEQAPIDERDIAAVAVRALATGELDGLAPVLTGPESLTQRQQVEMIAAALERPLRVQNVSTEAARADLAQLVPAQYVELLLAQWADEVGVRAVVTDAVQRITGRPAIAYHEWARCNAAAFGLARSEAS